MRLLLFITLVLIFSALNVDSAFAHILKTDGTIGAVLHVNPEDDPIAGEESSFFFEFKDKENRFQPINCICTVTVLQAGKSIYTSSLFENNTSPSLTNASFSFVFPEKDIYTVVVEGKAKNNSFEAFTLTYDIRVDKDAASASASNKSTYIAYFVIGGIAFFFVILYVIKMRRRGEK